MTHTATRLQDLHAPFAPLLRIVLAQAALRRVDRALDLACGPGLKTGWLAAALQPGGWALGVDADRRALHEACAMTEDRRVEWAAGDALALPLRDACVDLCWCVAALHQFADPALALCEMRRVMRRGGTLVVATVEQLWVRARSWPPDLSAALSGALAVSGGDPGLLPADGLADALIARLATAGFTAIRARAFLLDATLMPWVQELTLADWPHLRTRVASLLDAVILERCDAYAAAEPEPVIAPVLLIASALKAE